VILEFDEKVLLSGFIKIYWYSALPNKQPPPAYKKSPRLINIRIISKRGFWIYPLVYCGPLELKKSFVAIFLNLIYFFAKRTTLRVQSVGVRKIATSY